MREKKEEEEEEELATVQKLSVTKKRQARHILVRRHCF